MFVGIYIIYFLSSILFFLLPVAWYPFIKQGGPKDVLFLKWHRAEQYCVDTELLKSQLW